MEKIATRNTKLLHLQGIRGLAVIAITAFHFYPAYFSHGYLGVDIFFALSGYLMTMMLTTSESLDCSAVIGFFYRRIKRIVPLYYLITFFILVALNFSPAALRDANVMPALSSLLFISNVFQSDSGGGYFAKLGVSVDLFTHTWSLSLELQYYLIFPFIFFFYNKFPEGRKNSFLGVIGFLSFFFYCFSEEFTSFNSVFSRIWQFNAGMLIYTIVNSSSSEYRVLPSETDDQTECLVPRQTRLGLSSIYGFVALLGLMLSTQNMYNHISRVLAVVFTMQLLQFGEGSFLENRILVEVGEISYAWYLVHWPFFSACKLLNVTDPLQLFGVLLLTFFLSAFLHYTYENFYLKLDKQAIAVLVVVLLIINGTALVVMKTSIPASQMVETHLTVNTTQVENSFNYPSDFLQWKPDYANKSNEERVALIEGFQATDLKRTMLKQYCKPYIKTAFSKELRCRFEEGLTKDAPMRLLVIGNSYAGNIFPVILDECKNLFSHMEISFFGGCEALVRSDFPGAAQFLCSQDIAMIEAVKEVNPDVLFLVDRHITFLNIINGTTPFDDVVFKTASERLTEIQKHVKKRIFILDDFPEKEEPLQKSIEKLKGTLLEIDDNFLNAQTFNNIIGRMRIARLVNECPKCKTFDYTPQFFFDGQFKFYDPKYFVSFTTMGRHLTPPALSRVRPLIRHLCQTL